MEKKSLFLGMTMGTAIGVFALVFVLGFMQNQAEISENEEKSEGITLNPIYHVTQVRDGEVIFEKDVHNVITTLGLNATRDKLGRGAGSLAAFDWMALAPYEFAPTATDSSLINEFRANSLDRAQGTYSEGDGNGNWSISYKWTATGSAYVGKFAVFNITWSTATNETMFSVGNFTSNDNVSMLANDQLTVNVTYVVS